MNYFNKEILYNTLDNKANLVDLEQNQTSSATIMEYGGRLLGLFPQNTSYNLLWVNPKILDIISSNFRSIGGERYWISPEREFFYKNPKTWEDWYCQEGLDPAKYEILDSDDKSCTISTPLDIRNNLTKERYRGEITRQFRIINEPMKTGFQKYCGVEIIDDCVIYKPNLKINGWSISCVISGGTENPGTVLIPTKQEAKPLSYFRTIPHDRLNISTDHVSFKIDVDDIYKLAIRPEDLDFNINAKIAYVIKIPDSEEYGILIKLSNDIPNNQNDCFDLSRDHPNGEIGVVQSYNSSSLDKPLLNYGELELQLNKFKTIENTSHGKALHLLCGYIGTKDEILEIIKKYLSINEPFLF
jgi:hypothetical protein